LNYITSLKRKTEQVVSTIREDNTEKGYGVTHSTTERRPTQNNVTEHNNTTVSLSAKTERHSLPDQRQDFYASTADNRLVLLVAKHESISLSKTQVY